jgi:hypothetical protein
MPKLRFTFAAFLVADNHDGLVVETRHAAHDGGIVGERAVAVQFFEIGEHARDVVECVWP